jgi:plastocyanin
MPLLLALVTAIGLALAPLCEARAQTLTSRTPNLEDGWTGSAGTLHFHFLHRFGQSGPPLRKVSSAPTFLLAVPLGGRKLLGVRYATNSELVPGVPNEWELLARWGPLVQERGAFADVALDAAYNAAARSLDAQLLASRTLGRIRLLGGGRFLADAGGTGESRLAAAAGAVVRLTPALAAAGDVAVPFGEDATVVWGAGLQLAIPYTPHSLSLHASNTNTATLQGSTLAAQRVRYGFEFTVPVTLARYFRSAPRTADVAAPAGDVVRVDMRALQYEPGTISVPAGTVVEWVNGDELMHTVTSHDGAFDSGEIEPGERWRYRFDRPGRFPYHCTPHPFMRGVVIVTEAR